MSGACGETLRVQRGNRGTVGQSGWCGVRSGIGRRRFSGGRARLGARGEARGRSDIMGIRAREDGIKAEFARTLSVLRARRSALQTILTAVMAEGKTSSGRKAAVLSGEYALSVGAPAEGCDVDALGGRECPAVVQHIRAHAVVGDDVGLQRGGAGRVVWRRATASMAWGEGGMTKANNLRLFFRCKRSSDAHRWSWPRRIRKGAMLLSSEGTKVKHIRMQSVVGDDQDAGQIGISFGTEVGAAITRPGHVAHLSLLPAHVAPPRRAIPWRFARFFPSSNLSRASLVFLALFLFNQSLISPS
ncbi:hypothetical protein FB451DRAFT_1186879 [Mycena latifolia]|nr:hypothetical protein FB451DRAFT_1186879 [Mycena latifolia]